jgi:NADH:ubiquinone oxidoreductase subunit 5 (subunit L)/multisubunit Na+/H+ antiporter MnhA subunit
MGVAFAGNLLTFFVFYELLSVLTYVLVVHDQTPAGAGGGPEVSSPTCSSAAAWCWPVCC